MPSRINKDSASMKEGKYSIFVVPKQDVSKESLDIFSLKSPNGRKSLFMSTIQGDLRELRAYSDSYRSWFIGDVIESDGRLWIATEFDPIFLALPYLKEGNRVPLDHLILESRITDSPFLKNRLPLVADPIGNADLNVWKLNDDKCMEYLSKKVKAIAKVLSENSIHIDSTSAEGFSKSSSTKGVEEHYLKYSWGLISDYIDKETSIQLKSHMNIITDETTTNKRRSSSSGEGSSKGLKRVKSAPQEDYLSLPKETCASLPQNSKQKALAKSATGSKNITSFFSKK
uniref:Ribonuclease H2 subunit B n=1 Tax=Lepeophtheirus salmonis TaxID=72036 RepID=D3PJF5_LEPSM|nr:Ribonuclease H2 subunit B [Lepeophtheirus salmonis]